VRGGENIYPSEIEHVLSSHPAVREVAVVGVADRLWGEIVKAVVVAADPHDLPSTDELRHHAAASMAHFKVPAVVEFVAELPRNAAGKILRRELR
jgi:acyl-CoA synthetase (AMP-forming)/AMP-acid ligase II